MGSASIYTWRVVAKMNTQVGAPPPNDPYYKTTSLTRTFTTSGVTSQTIYTTQTPDPEIASVNYEVGTVFSTSQTGFVTHLRFRQAATETGSHTLKLYNQSGAVIAQVVIPAGGGEGWKEGQLTPPGVQIVPGFTYRVAYNTNAKLSKKVGGGAISNGYLTVGSNGGSWRLITAPPSAWAASSSWYFADVKVSY